MRLRSNWSHWYTGSTLWMSSTCSYLVAEVVDLLVQVVGFGLKLLQAFVLGGHGPEEAVLPGVQQVLGPLPGVPGLSDRAGGAGHGGVAPLLRLRGLPGGLLHLLKLICGHN